MARFMYDYLTVFDLETTDIEVCRAHGEVPEIVEIGAVKLSFDFSIIGTFSSLVRPKNLGRFTKFSEKFTGIYKSELENSPTWPEISSQFDDFVGKGCHLASYGASFDFSILKNTYNDYRLNYCFARQDLDILTMVMTYCIINGWFIEPWSLTNVCRKFGIDRSSVHRALPDARDAALVLKRMFMDHPEITEEYRLIEV